MIMIAYYLMLLLMVIHYHRKADITSKEYIAGLFDEDYQKATTDADRLQVLRALELFNQVSSKPGQYYITRK